MTTLESICFTLAGGLCVTAVSLACFGVAVKARHPYIAPRCTARPRDSIYNPDPQHSCQDRGSPMFGWIQWTLGLTYDTMMRGIPGTGTRDGGMGGSMLSVKLDGIVLLRFHTVALKVAGLATFLLLGIILPAYASGQCYIRGLADEDGRVSGCATTAYNVTNYERTTIANVPSIPDVVDSKESLFITQNGTLGRLYAVTIVMWIVTAYFLYCLKHEWIQILAMRRVYYLESDIWEERCAELRETLLHEEVQRRERKKKTHFTFEETKRRKEEERHLVERDPWIPHPEQRDTVPNIALYSVLVGGLPSLPEQAVDPMHGGDVVTLTKRDSIDWQLSLTAAFFDHCVPNQPGFSSSVAAVSIMPSSKAIAVAWRKWYKAARKLRRLRFIRDQISQRRHYDIVLDTPDGEQQEVTRNLQAARQMSTRGFLLSPWFSPTPDEENESPPPIYKSQDKNRDYYRQVLGSVRDQEAEKQVYDAFHFGPEQTAVYSREFAQSSAACCPNGCFEGSIRRAKIDELIQMEREAAEAVHEANLELLKARRMAVRWEQQYDEYEDEDEDEDEEEMEKLDIPETILEDAGAQGKVDDSEKSVLSASSTPAPKSAPTSPPSTDRKESKHRRKPTLESVKFPEDMNLEVELFQKASFEFAKASSREMNRDRANSAGVERTPKKPGHRRKPSLETMQLPSSLGLEADILSNRSGSSLQGNNSNQDLSKTSSRELFDRDTSQSSYSERPTESRAPGTSRKDMKHRRIASLDAKMLPDDLGLEANLFNKASEFNLQQCFSDGGQYKSSRDTLSRQSSKIGSSGKEETARPDGEELIDLNTPKIRNVAGKTDNTHDTKVAESAALDQIDLEAGEANITPEESQWSLVQNIVANVSLTDRSKKRKKKREIASGAWQMPSLRSLLKKTRKTATSGATKMVKTVTDKAIDALDIQRESSYAVVTFTSRQAAVAARHCLSDGRGTDRWITYPNLPIPPLADAAAGEMLACRNCCKPVTLSIHDRQKDYRKFCALALLATIYIFYTIPLTAASRFVDPESIEEVFPNLSRWTEENWGNGAELISGLLQSSIWTGFFALCPVMFRAISNFGSGATSAANAEFKALIYFWYFMTISAFSSTLISNMFLQGLNNGRLGGEFREVIREIARTIPSVHAVSWLNWIIFRFTILLPVNYLLNLNAFVFKAINFKCCARVVMGGGPGTPTPYRIYVDSGIVLLCLLALAPSSPILAPACFSYFLVFQPILRRNLIYLYRPKFDGGGFRWPFIFDMCISCVVAGQILLTTQMILKQAAGPAIAASLPMLPTILFHRAMKRQYLRAFEDAALLQTSLLDGWDNVDETSAEKREEFRRFLVDAHKAAYIPVCIASGDEEEGLTAEPAVVVPLDTDVQKDLLEEPLHSPYQSLEVVVPQAESTERRPTMQHGATLRRAANTLAALRRRGDSSMDSGIFKSMRNLNIVPEPSPFDRRASLASTKSKSGSDKRAAFQQMRDDSQKYD